MESFEILVVILSVTLTAFLLAAIVFIAYLIKIARRVQDITDKAKAAADSVESAARIFKKTAGPAVFSRILANVVDGWQSYRSHKRKE